MEMCRKEEAERTGRVWEGVSLNTDKGNWILNLGTNKLDTEIGLRVEIFEGADCMKWVEKSNDNSIEDDISSWVFHEISEDQAFCLQLDVAWDIQLWWPTLPDLHLKWVKYENFPKQHGKQTMKF